MPENINIRFNEAGLVPVIAQDANTKAVLLLAWADQAALQATISTGFATYFSRSRARQWVKGETSGHVQRVRAIYLDCDGDTLLYLVDQEGSACHTGSYSCFDAGGEVSQFKLHNAELLAKQQYDKTLLGD